MRYNLLLVLALAMFAFPASAQDGPLLRPSISISGEGTVMAKPDRATINSAVVTEGKTAREALDANTAAMTQVIDSYRRTGIEERDIITSGFNIQPRYVYPERKNNSQNEAPRITGYEVRNSVTVRVRDLAKLGEVLDQAVSSGANQFSGLSFDVSDADRRLDEARKQAFADARRKAEIYASASDAKIGRVVQMNEGGAVRPMPMMMRADFAEAKSAAPVPVANGEMELQVSVNVTFELEN